MQENEGRRKWEQVLLDHLSLHRETEQEFVSEYKRLAEGASSPTLSYLGQLVIDDQERHRRLLFELDEAARHLVELRDSEEPSADLGYLASKRDEVLAATVRFVQFERSDADQIRRIAADLDPVRDKLWYLVLNLMQDEIHRHLRVLEFVRDRALHVRTEE
jgi:hypothetical protein